MERKNENYLFLLVFYYLIQGSMMRHIYIAVDDKFEIHVDCIVEGENHCGCDELCIYAHHISGRWGSHNTIRIMSTVNASCMPAVGHVLSYIKADELHCVEPQATLQDQKLIHKWLLFLSGYRIRELNLTNHIPGIFDISCKFVSFDCDGWCDMKRDYMNNLLCNRLQINVCRKKTIYMAKVIHKTITVGKHGADDTDDTDDEYGINPVVETSPCDLCATCHSILADLNNPHILDIIYTDQLTTVNCVIDWIKCNRVAYYNTLAAMCMLVLKRHNVSADLIMIPHLMDDYNNMYECVDWEK